MEESPVKSGAPQALTNAQLAAIFEEDELTKIQPVIESSPARAEEAAKAGFKLLTSG